MSKYALAAHLAILAVASLLLSPACVFYLTGISAIWLIMEPSRIGFETTHDARKRVWHKIATDPVFWLCLILVVVTGIRFFNTGIDLAYDAEKLSWSISSPRLPLMPGSVTGHGVSEFALMCALTVLLQGCRHALGRSARMAFFLVSSTLSGAGAITMATMLSSGNATMLSLMRISIVTPMFIGSIFGVYLLAGVVALHATFDRMWFKAMPLVPVAIGGNLAGLFLFAPPVLQAVFFAAALVLCLYEFFSAWRNFRATTEFKLLVFFSMSVAFGVILIMITMPKAAYEARIQEWMKAAFFPENFWVVRKALAALCQKSWLANPWLGSGLGSFTIDLRFLATDSDWILFAPEQTAPLNGYWHLLVERGIIGAVLIAAPLLFLLWTYSRRLVKGVRQALPDPACWAGLLALLAVVAETLVDSSFTLPGLLLSVAVFLALAASSFPREVKSHHGR